MSRHLLFITSYLVVWQLACTPDDSGLPGNKLITSLSADEASDLCDWAINDFFGGTGSEHPCPSEPDTYAKLVSTVEDCIQLIVDLRSVQCNVAVDEFEECMRAQQRDLCLEEYEECMYPCGATPLPQLSKAHTRELASGQDAVKLPDPPVRAQLAADHEP